MKARTMAANAVITRTATSQATKSTGPVLLDNAESTTAKSRNNNNNNNNDDTKYFQHFKLYFLGLICGSIIQITSYYVATAMFSNMTIMEYLLTGMLYLFIFITLLIIVRVSSSSSHHHHHHRPKSYINIISEEVFNNTGLFKLSYMIVGQACGVFLATLMIEWSLKGQAQSLLSIRLILGATHLIICLILNCYHQRIHDLLVGSNDDDDDDDVDDDDKDTVLIGVTAKGYSRIVDV